MDMQGNHPHGKVALALRCWPGGDPSWAGMGSDCYDFAGMQQKAVGEGVMQFTHATHIPPHGSLKFPSSKRGTSWKQPSLPFSWERCELCTEWEETETQQGWRGAWCLCAFQEEVRGRAGLERTCSSRSSALPAGEIWGAVSSSGSSSRPPTHWGGRGGGEEQPLPARWDWAGAKKLNSAAPDFKGTAGPGQAESPPTPPAPAPSSLQRAFSPSRTPKGLAPRRKRRDPGLSPAPSPASPGAAMRLLLTSPGSRRGAAAFRVLARGHVASCQAAPPREKQQPREMSGWARSRGQGAGRGGAGTTTATSSSSRILPSLPAL